MTLKAGDKSPCCNICDNYIFGDKGITVEEPLGKIKLCSKLCFEKYMIMVEQRAMKGRSFTKKEAKKP
jgi:hypothetical protein